MRVTALAGGIGGARFLRGVLAALPEADVTVIGNTGDDITLHGLRICPDLDTVMYTLGGGISAERGWGREGESFVVAEELAAYGVGPAWFGLGDRDLATHLVRTRMLDAGYSLSDVVRALCERWKPGVRLLPMSDERVETHVVISDADGQRAVHFQEWWLRLRAAVPAQAIIPVNAEKARPAPGVLAATADADVVLLPPSNPVVSIGTILAVPGIRSAVRGMADACLAAIGVETSAQAVGVHYGGRGRTAEPATAPATTGHGTAPRPGDGTADGLLDGWLVDTADAGATVPGATVAATPLLMTDLKATVAIVRAALELAGV